jgi:hypothetical protein
MAVSAARVTVSTSAVALNTASTDGTTLVIKNGAQGIDLGASGVTAGAGLSVAASVQVTVFLKPGDVLYAIRSGGTDSVVEVLRT